MALLDNITLHPIDLVNILAVLKQIGHNAQVKIIDTNGSITIRDTGEQFLGEVKKEDNLVWDGG